SCLLPEYCQNRSNHSGSKVLSVSSKINNKKTPSFEINQNWEFIKGRQALLNDTGGRGRTDTPVKERDFESRASANSATPANYYGGGNRTRTGDKGVADPCLTTWLCRHNFWSGRRGSNPRPPPWQGGVLPLNYFRKSWGTWI